MAQTPSTVTPHLAVNISYSPLLPTIHTEDLLFALLTKRTLTSSTSQRLPYSLSPAATSISSCASSASSSLSNSLGEFHPPVAILHQANIVSADKPLPSLPASQSAAIPQSIISLLNLLDCFDADVALQVARVNEGIREARLMVEAYRTKREERLKRDLCCQQLVRQCTKYPQ